MSRIRRLTDEEVVRFWSDDERVRGADLHTQVCFHLGLDPDEVRVPIVEGGLAGETLLEVVERFAPSDRELLREYVRQVESISEERGAKILTGQQVEGDSEGAFVQDNRMIGTD